MKFQKLAAVATIALMLSLVGCAGSGPSEEQLKQAVLKYVSNNGIRVQSVSEFRTGDCEQVEGLEIFKCSISMKGDAIDPMGRLVENGIIASADGAYFAKTNEIWMVTKSPKTGRY